VNQPDLFMATVLDAFSRAPLALQVFAARPSAKDMARLFRTATRLFARPKYMITDRGGEFTATVFRKAVQHLGAVQRFASQDNLYATARLERLWRTLKETAGLYRFRLPLTAEDLEHRLQVGLLHYLCFRPHEGLRGATPLEAFLGVEPACLRAVEPPRGRRGESQAAAPFRIDYLDPRDRRFPILSRAA
jgi:transposase InsO family protein